jgi:hypothetical protein
MIGTRTMWSFVGQVMGWLKCIHAKEHNKMQQIHSQKIHRRMQSMQSKIIFLIKFNFFYKIILDQNSIHQLMINNNKRP